MSRARRIAYYGLPILFCLGVHFLALRTWFSGDDFAWLGLPQELKSNGLWPVLFTPEAQGTVRTLSERLYFLTFTSVFGLEAAPLRIWAFLTEFANIALLIQIARRLTGSSLAGFLAPLLWVANASLALAMGWSSAYNEILFAFFLLLAFRLLLAYIDTGRQKYWIWQWIVFLLGFGALELNAMYPVLAAGYALGCARPYFRKTLWLFVPSALFTIAHFAIVPAAPGPYRMHFDASIFTTLWHYWFFALGAWRDSPDDWRPVWLGFSIAAGVTIALLWFAVSMLRRHNWLPIFLIGWLFVVILPVLPLRDHFTEYYLMVPVIGLAILGAWALAQARGAMIPLALGLTGLYFMVSIVETHVTESYYYVRARKIKYLITALESLPKGKSDSKILLASVDSDLFWACFMDDPFRLIGNWKVFLAPGAERNIEPHPEWGDISRFTMSPSDAYLVISRGQGKIYEPVGRSLHDVTRLYQPELAKQYRNTAPKFVDVGDSLYQDRLGPTWYVIDGRSRWMPKTATVEIAGPEKDGQVLEIMGYCPALVVAKGPLEVWFRANGVEIGKASLGMADQSFQLRFPVPRELVGKNPLELEIEVSRTAIIPPDVRPLGLIFGTFTIK